MIVVLAVLPAAASAQERVPFTVGPVVAGPGQQASGYLEIAAGVDEGTSIPVTVVHGAGPGPVLALIAGTHGYEYPPITALQQVRATLDPARLAGTVIMVHVANMPSFLGRTVYYSPVDGKNLNRVYPGRPDGTVSERIAHAITTEVIDRADYVIDLHCGDGNEALRPYTYWMITGDAELDAASRELAIAFGLDHIVIDRGRPDDAGASVYTANTGLTRGKPSITTETGQLGTNDAEWVALAERGVWNLLRHLRMMPGEVERPGAIVWLDRYEVLRSPVTGIFRPAVRDGYAVAEGGLIGTLVDFFGEPIEEVRAPFAGIVNYVVATPPVREGEPLGMVSHVQQEPR
ncbi:MAG: succinylglutamate desuccinylase/aspartoacylase family protein [Gemmatimonadota bacterium]|nr:MAG: succinylglutamate desuccinylase/aspartoacylase family protein [Gemmatimonadota bacterium]